MRLPAIPTDVKASMQRFLRDLSQVLDSEFKQRVPNTQGQAELLLVSPTGKVYSVRVDDAGAISTTLMNE